MPAAADERVPVTLLAGFLGSGKTTLLNRILARGGHVAVVVNEFGDVGIDGKLVVGATDELVELSNGCVCCAVRGDLVRSVGRLLERSRGGLLRRARPLDRIVVEASGLASPGPIVQTFAIEDRLAAGARVDSVVTLAHAALIEDQLREHPEAADQLALADRVLLNHADRADAEALDAAEAAARAAAPLAEVTRCTRADVPLDALLAPAERDAAPRFAPIPGAAPSEPAAHAHGAVEQVALASDAPLDLHALKTWLAHVAADRRAEVLRLKGFLRCEDHGPPVVVQAVHQWLELGPGEGAAPERSHLVVLGRRLDRAALERGWRAAGGVPPQGSRGRS